MQKKNLKLKTQNSKLSQGFTLLETLIAITVLLLSVVGPMTVASKGLASALYAKDEITAFYLGQEAVEYIRNARDTNYLIDCYGSDTSLCNDKTVWLSGLNECTGASGCYVDVVKPFRTGSGNSFNTDAIETCSSDGCPTLLFDGTLYGYDTGNPSKYTRKINISTVSADEIKIEVSVSWYGGSLLSSVKTFTVIENLLNWQR